MSPRVLLVDNYDSFVHNLAHALAAAGAEPELVRNDRVDPGAVVDRFQGIVISPGPGHPANPGDFGRCLELISGPSLTIPTLGVCLGHQGIAHAFGGRVVKAPAPLHGKAVAVEHDGRGIYAGVPSPMMAGRYHSLCVLETALPDCFEVTARGQDGVVMGIRHRQYPIEGVQFHPESILTDHGQELIDNFVRSLGGGP